MRKLQTGSTLLEGMIAIVIFSFGMLGTISFQANMLSQTTQTSHRLNADMAVASLIGAAEADSANYPCYVYPLASSVAANCTNANAYVTTWANGVKTLPGATAHPPTSTYDAVSGNLTVTVKWKLANESSESPAHSFVSVAHPIAGG